MWNRQRRDEDLLDVEDVAAGYQTKLRWNDSSEWIWSAVPTHEALVSSEDFATVQMLLAAGAHRPVTRKARNATRVYPLSGLVRCASCGRRMEGTHAHGVNRYRCKFPSEYALANKIDHPRTVYLKEAAVVPKLDAWLAQLFDEENLDATCEALAMAGKADDAAEARAEAARRKIAGCDQRLAKYRQALDAGADAAVVAGWMAEVQGERLRAEQELGAAIPGKPLTKGEVRRLVEGLRDIVAVLATADLALKAQVYAELGDGISYDAERRVVTAETRPNACTTARVGEGT